MKWFLVLCGFVCVTDSSSARIFAGSERALLAGDHLRPASHDQLSPAVATDGDIFVAVWAHRALVRGLENYDILAARFSSDGKPIDDLPIQIAVSNRDENGPDVVWDGKAFFVAWSEGQEVHARLLRADGSLLPEFRVRSASIYETVRLSASNGRVLLLSQEIVSGITQKTWASIFINGAEVAHDIPLSSGEAVVAVAASTSEFLVVSARPDFSAPLGPNGYGSVLYGVTIDPSTGSLSHESQLAPNQFRFGVTAASDGSSFLVSWQTSFESNGRVRCIAVRADDSISGTTDTETSETPAGLQWNGTAYVLFGVEEGRVYSSLFDRSGVRVSNRIELTHDGLPRLSAAPVAFNGRRMFVPLLTGGYQVVSTDVYAVLTGSDGVPVVRDPFWVARSFSDQFGASFSSGGGNLLVWVEERPDEGGFIAFAGLVGPTGALASSARLGPYGYPGALPRAAFDGSQYLVAWFDGTSLKAARISGDGFPIGELSEIGGNPGSTRIGLTWNGDVFIVSYPVVVSYRPSRSAVDGFRVGRDGKRVDAPVIRLADTNDYGIAPEDNGVTLFSSGPLRASLLDQGGAVVSSSSSNEFGFDVSISTNVGRHLGTFRLSGVRAGGPRTVGWFLVDRGVLIPGGQFDRDSLVLDPLAVIETHDGYLIAWSEMTARGDTDVFGLEVDRAGNAVSAVTPLADSSSDELEPALRPTSDGVVLVYKRSVDELGTSGIFRLQVRVLQHDSLPRTRGVRR